MTEKKAAETVAQAAPKKTEKPKSLAYGSVHFKPFLWKGKWRFINKAELEKQKKVALAKIAKAKAAGEEIKRPEPKKKNRQSVIVKPIKGDKNGESRRVYSVPRKNYYPSFKRPNIHRARGLYSTQKQHFRASLQPGSVLILLAGVNKGKRAVLLKTLPSGLLLVTGPYLLNGVPLRRVQPGHVIATKTRLDLSTLTLPDDVNDQLFKRVVETRSVKKGDRTVFVPKKKAYKPSERKKELQKIVDDQVLKIVKQHPEKKVMFAYLSAMFGLKNNQYPHRMQF